MIDDFAHMVIGGFFGAMLTVALCGIFHVQF